MKGKGRFSDLISKVPTSLSNRSRSGSMDCFESLQISIKTVYLIASCQHLRYSESSQTGQAIRPCVRWHGLGIILSSFKSIEYRDTCKLQ